MIYKQCRFRDAALVDNGDENWLGGIAVMEDFDDADKWVGIYIHLKRIEGQKIVEKQEEEDGRPSDQ